MNYNSARTNDVSIDNITRVGFGIVMGYDAFRKDVFRVMWRFIRLSAERHKKHIGAEIFMYHWEDYIRAVERNYGKIVRRFMRFLEAQRRYYIGR